MSDILCIYYSRTGHTRRAMEEVADALGAEVTAITDDRDRNGWRGYIRCGMDAMKTSTRPLLPFQTEKPLNEYRLVIIGSPVWAGRCASPVRALLKRRGLEMRNVAYLVTRSTSQRSEEVYDQMDMYVKDAHRMAVSLRPGSEGYEFWRNDFVQNVRRWMDEQLGRAMLEKLKAIEQRLTEVEQQLSDPAVYGDRERLTALSREQKELTPVVACYRAYLRAQDTAREAEEMLSDPELRALAQEELAGARADMERLQEELKRLLLPRDPNDEKNVILEIRAGIGGEEGALFAADLLRMYTMYAERRGWTLSIVNENMTELGGVKEVSAEIEGAGAWSRLKFEAGTHRVQRVPETESSGRIQTSAATVAVMPEAEEVEFSIDPKDLQIDTFRSSGAGGQHVNKTESAIRITHLPTGVVVECQDERSQYKNKDRAMKILRSKLYEAEQEKQNAAIAATRKSQVGTGDRSGKIRTYNFPQNRVTDHRLTGDSKNFNIAAIMNGDLDDLIDALTLNEQAQRLQEGKE